VQHPDGRDVKKFFSLLNGAGAGGVASTVPTSSGEPKAQPAAGVATSRAVEDYDAAREAAHAVAERFE